jgi:hypothetical protein
MGNHKALLLRQQSEDGRLHGIPCRKRHPKENHQEMTNKASIVLEIKAVFSNLETKIIELITEKRA